MSLNILTGGTQPGPWHAASDISEGAWYIVNVQTHKSKRMGLIKGYGTNYYDAAKTEALKRNSILFEKARAENKLPTLLGISPEMDAAVEHALKADRNTRDLLGAIREGDDLACRVAQAATRDPLYDLAWDLIRNGLNAAKFTEIISHACRDYPKEAADKVLEYMKRGR